MLLQTPRLVLREMTQDDFPALCQMLYDPLVMAAYEGAFSPEEAQNWLSKQLARYAKDGFGLWAVVQKDTGCMIGQCGLTWQLFEDRQVMEVGYLFQRAAWHHGFATEAARACIRYGFDRFGASRIYAIIRDNNTASQNVARRCGLRPVGGFTKHYRGVDMPHIAFAIDRPAP